MHFIWKIENFSHLNGQKLQSPSFSTHFGNWELLINENIRNYERFFEVELNCLEFSNTEVIPKNCSFALLDFQGLPLVWKDNNISCYRDIYKGKYILRNAVASLIKKIDVFGSRKTQFLPNDILTVQCRLWNIVDELISPLSIFARSRVESEEVVKTFEWNISEANLFQNGYILEHEEPILNCEFLMIKLLSTQNKLKFESKVSMFRCNMRFQVMMLDAMKRTKVHISSHDYKFTTKDEKWTFETEIPRNMITAHQNLFLSDNTITLHFICSFSEYVKINKIVVENGVLNIPMPIITSNQISEASASTNKPKVSQPTNMKPFNTISQALQDLLMEGLLSDFNLKVGDKKFPVHKAILSARSQVFRAMFTTEMKEREDNFVDIPDVDEGTLQRMLQFVYSDKFDEDMGWESASSLYAAADKYAIEPLKQSCSAVIKSGLCVSSVLEVLSMADLHQDQDLKTAALDFISLNDQFIVGTECWSKFEKENAKLALDTFHSLYLKKMKG